MCVYSIKHVSLLMIYHSCSVESWLNKHMHIPSRSTFYPSFHQPHRHFQTASRLWTSIVHGAEPTFLLTNSVELSVLFRFFETSTSSPHSAGTCCKQRRLFYGLCAIKFRFEGCHIAQWLFQCIVAEVLSSECSRQITMGWRLHDGVIYLEGE